MAPAADGVRVSTGLNYPLHSEREGTLLVFKRTEFHLSSGGFSNVFFESWNLASGLLFKRLNSSQNKPY